MGRPKGSKNKTKMGRPLIPIDKDRFEALCGIFCTEEDIANEFSCSVDTINNWCKRTYQTEEGKPMTFSEVYRVKSGRGRNSLRSFLFKKCKDGNATILKFMAMNELGMTDRVTQSLESDGLLSEFTDLMKSRSNK